MPIDPAALSFLASEYTEGMTSIRGRRVQRLLMREFGGAEHVLLIQADFGIQTVLGLSVSGAAQCATEGRGKQASIVKWLHGSTEALESHFDLLRDSLPLLSKESVSLAAQLNAAAMQPHYARLPTLSGAIWACITSSGRLLA